MKDDISKLAIVVNKEYYEEVNYHVSNNKISVIFDGKGAITSYSEANKKEYFNVGYCSIHEGNTPLSVFTKKTVTMIGRIQETEIKLTKGKLRVTQFLDQSTNGVFMCYELIGRKIESSIDIAVMFSKIQNAKVLTTHLIKEIDANSSFIITLNKYNRYCKVFISFAEEYEDIFEWDEDNKREYYSESPITSYTFTHLDEIYNDAYKNCIEEIESIKVPDNLSALETKVFYNTYFCALENYKDKDEFKAFMAGHKYSTPLRSYYRDSYYTVLPLYNEYPDKIRNQIITLASGVEFNYGRQTPCPSAVKSDYSSWWSGHYDSPSFFIMMLYDYVKHTKDVSILSQVDYKDRVIYDLACNILDEMSNFEVLGLIYKRSTFNDIPGKHYDELFNKQDWADEVNRFGFVCYDNILYARAYKCMSELAEIMDNKEESKTYLTKYNELVHLIDRVFWNEKLGYYTNFQGFTPEIEKDAYYENNLSIDTVLAINFGIASKDKAKKALLKMEEILECKNNKEYKKKRPLKRDDFGVMCVYPPYSDVRSAYNKSSQPFNYHNGANWPYLTAMYAHAKREYGLEYKHLLTDWFIYNLNKGNYTPVEYFSPFCKDGSLLQAWNGAVAFVLNEELSKEFWK